jgi:prostaglandin-H2 D-isomerase / glutathione transferase
MSSLKLVYFNAKGFAETSRLVLAFANADFEDYRYPIKINDWKLHDIVKEEFDLDKQEGKLIKSLNKVPYLEIDGEIIGQSKAIERYLARRFNMMGDSEIEEFKIDAICEWIRDFKTNYQKEKVNDINNWFSVLLPQKMELLENIVSEVYSVGNRVSLSDIVIYSFITQFFDNKEGAMNSLNSCPNIKSVVENISSQQSIKDWIQKRPDTGF